MKPYPLKYCIYAGKSRNSSMRGKLTPPLKPRIVTLSPNHILKGAVHEP
jgi:hypothetical protein